ncbi:MAG: hypothetical protein E5X43_24345, partial [Mesorhizobium sp.]
MIGPEKCCDSGAGITVLLTLYLKFYVSHRMQVFFTPVCHYDTKGPFSASCVGHEKQNQQVPRQLVQGSEGMAKKTTTTRTLDNDVARELEKALEIDLSGDTGGDLDIAASMEDLEAQISQAADELAREGRDQDAEPVA